MREMALRDLGRPKLLPKMSMVQSKLSRPKEQALNIEPKGSDRSGQRACLGCPVSTGKFELFPISHASGLAHPPSKWLKRSCRPM
jgi:hypothetical protein